jgi:four helix bundle protein
MVALQGAIMKDFRNLQVWHKAHQLTLASYQLTARFPREEIFGLTKQIRRCSGSIGANLAEGCGRRGVGEFHRFLQIAAGSASELEYHFLLAKDLDFMRATDHCGIQTQIVEVKKMLGALIAKVERERLASS